MRDSLDLNTLAIRIRKERHVSTRNWWIFGALVAGLIVLTGFLYIAAATSPDPCEVTLSCQLYWITLSSLPFLILISSYILSRRSWRQRRANAAQYLIELRSLELPPPIKPQKSSTRILLIVWFIIVFTLPFIFQIDPILLFFIGASPIVVIYRSVNYWLHSPLSSANYHEALRRVNVYSQWLPDALSVQGLIEFMAGYTVESERTNRQLLAQMIKSKTFEAFALNNLAYELILQERYKEALPLLESAIHINPHLASSYDSLAWWYLFQNLDSQRALELAEFGLQLPPRRSLYYQNASRVVSLATRAWAEARTGQNERSVATIKDALKKASPKNIPYYASTLFTLGEAKIALEDISGAREYFRQAAEIDPQGRFGKMAADTLKQLDDNSLI